MNFMNFIKNNPFIAGCVFLYRRYFQVRRSQFGSIHPSAVIHRPILVKGINNVYLGENTNIYGNATIITTLAKFVLKKNSGTAEGLTVITGNHYSIPGRVWKEVSDKDKEGKNMDKDIIVDEDVWIGANVTLLSGTHIGRGAVVGSGAVCRNVVPPYAIVIGNPAKVIGFRFTPDEIIEHEKSLYSEEERISIEKLEKNYKRYYFNRMEEIASFVK